MTDTINQIRAQLSDDELLRFTELLEMNGDALVKRGERMVRLGRELLQQSGNLAGMIDREQVERVVASDGAILTEREIIDAVVELGAGEDGKGWSRKDFSEKLHIKAPTAMMWLSKLAKRRYPVVGQNEDGTYYYVEAPDTGARRRRQTTPEQAAVDSSIERGQQVRQGTAVSRLKGKERSRPKSVSRAKRRDANYERNQTGKK